MEKSAVSSGVSRELSKPLVAVQPSGADQPAEEQPAAPQKVVSELQAIQTPREVQDLLWDTLPPVQHKRGRPIDNIRRKARTLWLPLLTASLLTHTLLGIRAAF